MLPKLTITAIGNKSVVCVVTTCATNGILLDISHTELLNIDVSRAIYSHIQINTKNISGLWKLKKRKIQSNTLTYQSTAIAESTEKTICLDESHSLALLQLHLR